MRVYNEPLLSALASHERALRLKDKNSPWLNPQRWAAIRALLVATDSETRRWLNKEKFFHAFLQLFPSIEGCKGWQDRWDKFKEKHPVAGRLDTTEQYCDLLAVVMADIQGRDNNQVESLDFHITVVYFSRNWSAHNGQNPNPSAEYLGSLVVTSVMRTLFVTWNAVWNSPKHHQNLARIYPSIAEKL